ncbi:MAG TPA: hypothetical protein VII36_10015, partial [Usitatibacter sp.]
AHGEVTGVLESMNHSIERETVFESGERRIERRVPPLAFAADSRLGQWHRAARACIPEARQGAIARGANDRPLRDVRAKEAVLTPPGKSA